MALALDVPLVLVKEQQWIVILGPVAIALLPVALLATKLLAIKVVGAHQPLVITRTVGAHVGQTHVPVGRKNIPLHTVGAGGLVHQLVGSFVEVLPPQVLHVPEQTIR
jgi:hypothetical protein